MNLFFSSRSAAGDYLKKMVVFFSFLLLIKNSPAQVINPLVEEDTSVFIAYIPKYSWSVGFGYSYVSSIFIYGKYLPDNFEIQYWISNRLYGQSGLFAIGDEFYHGNYFSEGFSVYSGISLKLFLFDRAWFTPSFNIYYDHFYNTADLDPHWTITAGPTASFEYFPWNRLTLRLDLINFNWGIAGYADNSTKSIITVHRLLGMGILYNFNLRKQE